MLNALLLAGALSQKLPTVRWEPFTETPPDIAFTVTHAEGKTLITNNLTKDEFKIDAYAEVEPQWAKSAHGDYWTCSVIANCEVPEWKLLGKNFGEIIWYQDRLWPFLPDGSVTLKRIVGISRKGELVENRFSLSQGHGAYFHSAPTPDGHGQRVVEGARVFPPTADGEVFAAIEGDVFNITEETKLIAPDASYLGSSPSGIFIRYDAEPDSDEYGQTFKFIQNKKGSWEPSYYMPNLHDLYGINNLPEGNFTINFRPSCLGGRNFSYYNLILNDAEYYLSDIAKHAGLDWQLELLGFKNGKLIVGKRNPLFTYMNPPIVGYLSIEGVTPGFKSTAK